MRLLSRRALLTASALLIARPVVASQMALEPAGDDQAAFRVDGIDGAITVPAARARIAFALPIAGREVAGVAFAADPPAGSLELVALCGWDGACLRILGLEMLSYAGADGASLASRFAGVGDRTRLRVERTASVPRPRLPLRWESWTDLLAWRDQAPLADMPVRPPLPDTRQAALTAARSRVAVLLSDPCQAVTNSMIEVVANAAAKLY
jgi:hypothetical protein